MVVDPGSLSAGARVVVGGHGPEGELLGLLEVVGDLPAGQQRQRADAIRDDIDKERRRPHSTSDRTELELALQTENDSLHQETQALKRRLRLKDEALAKARSQQLSQEESIIDLTTAQTIKDSNDQLAAERDAAKDAQAAGRANLAGKKLELALARREHGHTKDALEKARREIKRLQSHMVQ